MTRLGKILTFVVFLLALVWAWFTATAYVTRTNWRNQATMYKAAYDEARGARETEYKGYQSEKDALARQLATEQEKNRGLEERIASLQGANDKVVTRVEELEKLFKNADVTATELASKLRAALDELDKVRARSNALEDERKDLTLTVANANRDRQAAENRARQADSDKLLAEKRLEDATTELRELRATGAGGSVVPPSARPPAPPPEGLRGTVDAYDKGIMVVSVGIDAGVTVGSYLDVYRDTDGGKYLGRMKVERVLPKQSVGSFEPADPRRTLKQLRPDELPKAGDTVGQVRTSARQ